MADRERIKSLTVHSLDVTGDFTIAGRPFEPATPTPGPASPASPAPAGARTVGGLASVVGSGQVASGLTAITAVMVSLGQPPSPAACGVSATWSADGNLTLTVAGADGTIATAAALVNWIALGS